MRVRIAEIRKQQGVSQSELAERIGMSRPYLAQIENQTRNLSAVRQAAIAAALGVEPSTLVDFSAPDQDDEEFMLRSFRSLTPSQRKEWLALARVVTGSSKQQDE